MNVPYTHRVIDEELDELLPGLAAIALEGARGVGKTETASRRSRTIRRLDEPEMQRLARAEPSLVLEGERPVLLDEWQRIPAVWDAVRRAVDGGAAPGSFLLAGSSIPAELPVHSGAGRIVSLRMRPLSLSERHLAQPTASLAQLLEGSHPEVHGSSPVSLSGYAHEIVRSGLPGIRSLAPRQRRSQLDGYLARLAQRDFLEQGLRLRSPQTLRRWLTAYAAATSTCASYETIRDAATSGTGDKPAKSTTQPYRAILENLFIVDSLPGWLPTRSHIARLSSPPKHHLADPALAARLLGVDERTLLNGDTSNSTPVRDGSLFGALFESLVTLSVRVYAQQCEARVAHLRTKAGEREVDLVVERGDGRIVAIEVKLTAAPTDDDVRHLRWLGERIGDDLLDAVVVTTGSEAYRRHDGIAVIPAALLGA